MTPILKLIRLFEEYRDLIRNIHFFDKDDNNRSDEIQKMKKEQENLKLRKPNFQNDFMDGIITTQDYQEMKGRLDKDIVPARKKLTELQQEGSP